MGLFFLPPPKMFDRFRPGHVRFQTIEWLFSNKIYVSLPILSNRKEKKFTNNTQTVHWDGIWFSELLSSGRLPARNQSASSCVTTNYWPIRRLLENEPSQIDNHLSSPSLSAFVESVLYKLPKRRNPFVSNTKQVLLAARLLIIGSPETFIWLTFCLPISFCRSEWKVNRKKLLPSSRCHRTNKASIVRKTTFGLIDSKLVTIFHVTRMAEHFRLNGFFLLRIN